MNRKSDKENMMFSYVRKLNEISINKYHENGRWIYFNRSLIL